MTEEPQVYPLVIELIRRSPLRWRWIVAILTVLFLLWLVISAWLDGDLNTLSHWEFWRNFLDGPVLIIYFLVAYPILWQLWWQSAQSIQALSYDDTVNSKQAAERVLFQKRQQECAFFIIGVVFWFSLWQPWGWDNRWVSGSVWVSLYDVVTQPILFGLVSWVIYSSIANSQYLNRLIRQNPNVDIFNTGKLIPVARSGLGISIAFIGGISLSLIFQTKEDLLMWNNIMVWAILVGVAVLLFFLSVWRTHRSMALAKASELDWAQSHLIAATSELKEREKTGNHKGLQDLISNVNVWMNYERRIKEISDWPYNAGIIGRLAASVLAPVVVFFIKVLSGSGKF
jgi:hypothetical protein